MEGYYEYLHKSYYKVYTYCVACYCEVEFLRIQRAKRFLVTYKGLW